MPPLAGRAARSRHSAVARWAACGHKHGAAAVLCEPCAECGRRAARRSARVTVTEGRPKHWSCSPPQAAPNTSSRNSSNRFAEMETLAESSVLGAFIWPLRLLGMADVQQGQPDHLPLLSLPTHLLLRFVIPSLTRAEQAELSLVCKTLSGLVASCAQQLTFDDSGTLCMGAGSERVLQFTSVTRLNLSVRGWHDIGSAAVALLLHLSTALPSITAVTLLDKSHESLYEEPLAESPMHAAAAGLFAPAGAAAGAAGGDGSSGTGACLGCGSDSNLPDVCGVLMSLAATYQRLKRLELYTKLLSDTEAAALSRLPQLTSLTLNSEDGVAPGALCHLGQLAALQLGDVDGNNPEDVATICDMPPVLRRVHQLHAAVQAHAREQQEQQRHSAAAASAGILTKTVHAVASVASSAAAAAFGSSSGLMTPWPEEQAMPESARMLLDAGVDPEAISGPVVPALHGGGSSSPASSSLSSTGRTAGASAGFMQGPGSAAAAGSRAAGTSSSPSGPGKEQRGVTTSVSSDLGSAPTKLRVLTELSVNIDAEEGREILAEMSQLALLESLLVDSTDEFSIDPGFQPFGETTNLRRLAITMPLSLANTESLRECRQLRDLLLCALPTKVLGQGALQQVTRLELLDISVNPPNPQLLQAFPSVSHLIIRSGADDATLAMIGANLTSLEHLELYRLPAGYSQGGLRGIAHLDGLRTLVLELARPGQTLPARVRGPSSNGWPLGSLTAPLGLAAEVGSELSAAAGSLGIPLLGTNPILAFVPPSSLWTTLVPSLSGSSDGSSSSGRQPWFLALRQLSLLGFVTAADKWDLKALSNLTKLSSLSLHLTRPRGVAGSVTLRGLWDLVQCSSCLAEIRLTGYT